MRISQFFLSIAFASLFLGSAQAQDLDLDGGSKKAKKEFSVTIDDNVKEVTKGWYAKSTVGGAAYLLNLNGIVFPGAVLGMGIGQDFYDTQNISMAWEVNFLQAIHNVLSIEDRNYLGIECAAAVNCIQGDSRTFSLVASAEASWYPVKRFGIGARLGGGVMVVPLLMAEDYYIEEVISEWGNVRASIHESPHPLAMGGLTLEYYTKLAHFSIGADLDVSYVIGFDLGVSGNGYLKYTF